MKPTDRRQFLGQHGSPSNTTLSLADHEDRRRRAMFVPVKISHHEVHQVPCADTVDPRGASTPSRAKSMLICSLVSADMQIAPVQAV